MRLSRERKVCFETMGKQNRADQILQETFLRFMHNTIRPIVTELFEMESMKVKDLEKRVVMLEIALKNANIRLERYHSIFDW